jgi:hypothetical protein
VPFSLMMFLSLFMIISTLILGGNGNITDMLDLEVKAKGKLQVFE